MQKMVQFSDLSGGLSAQLLLVLLVLSITS